MKQKMTLQDVWDYYGTSSIIQTYEGFEFPDEARGFALVIASHEFYRYFDGGLIDPAMLLVDRTGWMKRELLKSLELCTPVSLRYAFGKATTVDGKTKFYMQDPTMPTVESMDILVEAEWDLRQGVSNEGWIPEVEKNWSGGLILFKKTMPKDTYETRGKQVWILRSTPAMMEIMKLKTDFYTWQRQMIERSDEVLKKFETEKEKYLEQIVDCLRGLPGRVHWIVAADEEELWPKFDANQELWVKSEYDWQITQFDERLEIRSRGGSPGVIAGEFPRYDAMGLQICRDLVAAQK